MRVTVDAKCGPASARKHRASIIAKIGTNARKVMRRYAAARSALVAEAGDAVQSGDRGRRAHRHGRTRPTTFAYVKGKPSPRRRGLRSHGCVPWQNLPIDSDAEFDTEGFLDASMIAPV